MGYDDEEIEYELWYTIPPAPPPPPMVCPPPPPPATTRTSTDELASCLLTSKEPGEVKT
jgi:hypothetical protein